MKTYVLSDPNLIHQKLTIYQHSSCTEVATLRMFLSKYFQIRKVQVVVMSVITAVVSRVSPYTTALRGADCGVRRGVCFHFNHLCTLTMSYSGLPGGQRCGARDRTEVASLEAKRRKVKKSKEDVYILKFICTYWAQFKYASQLCHVIQ